MEYLQGRLTSFWTTRSHKALSRNCYTKMMESEEMILDTQQEPNRRTASSTRTWKVWDLRMTRILQCSQFREQALAFTLTLHRLYERQSYMACQSPKALLHKSKAFWAKPAEFRANGTNLCPSLIRKAQGCSSPLGFNIK